MENSNTSTKTTAPSVMTQRRSFLRAVGAAAVTGGILTACSTADVQVSPNGARAGSAGDVITLPGGDLGILNYAFILEQIEARFYELVLANPYEGMTALEMQLFQDLRNHEVTHRAFYRTALMSAGIPDLTLDFSSIYFRQRTDVLEAARMFAEIGTAAYNGGGKYLTDPENLTVAGKIVSVEARHVSIIREMEYMNQTAFSGDNIVIDGLFIKKEPSEVLPMAQKYIRETIDARNLPTTVA
ncbi:twin-arginine translocation signal domain-containing protein [Spirosoma sp. HMF4905]|uniref:Twin-arginine translocation signal domain-containing protein n=1 Tax=Spirosoma arboris TaxID=2682092 RepID=A0A7K1SR40_9BACT|nr:ferritin-like domain-containing protein [Spirosoma arboris]MVM36261.1 twin-arginine translocation signal domain-containing protein [Spirosoma arboris]